MQESLRFIEFKNYFLRFTENKDILSELSEDVFLNDLRSDKLREIWKEVEILYGAKRDSKSSTISKILAKIVVIHINSCCLELPKFVTFVGLYDDLTLVNMSLNFVKKK